MFDCASFYRLQMRSVLQGVIAVSLMFGASQAMFGQTATGNIVGRVTDSSGAVLTGVNVTALNPEKGLKFRTVTDNEGVYRFFYLAPATYTLTFEHAGFGSVEHPGVQLQSNETPSVDAQMAVGNVVQKMEVAATSPLIETETSTTGTILAGKEMNTLPIMQRYTWMTMYLMPDVTSMNGFHIDGQRDRGLGYNLDGIAGTQPIVGGVATNGVTFTTGAQQPVTAAIIAISTTAPTDVPQYGIQSAAVLLAALPTLLVYFFGGQYFMRGLTAGALK